MTRSNSKLLPLESAAFVPTEEATIYLSLCVRHISNLINDSKLQKVYPRPRSAHITAESLTTYRKAIEQYQLPCLWVQPSNSQTSLEPRNRRWKGYCRTGD